MKLDVICAGREPRTFFEQDRSIVDYSLFDDHRRNSIVEDQVFRVDDDDALGGGEPELAVPSPAAGGLRLGGTRFVGLHAVGGAVQVAPYCGDPAIGEVVQIFAVHPVDAAGSADPKIAGPVRQSARRIVVKQPIFLGVMCHPAIADAKTGDSGNSAAQPKTSAMIV